LDTLQPVLEVLLRQIAVRRWTSDPVHVDNTSRIVERPDEHPTGLDADPADSRAPTHLSTRLGERDRTDPNFEPGRRVGLD
jgi:hypothetical protein